MDFRSDEAVRLAEGLAGKLVGSYSLYRDSPDQKWYYIES